MNANHIQVSHTWIKRLLMITNLTKHLQAFNTQFTTKPIPKIRSIYELLRNDYKQLRVQIKIWAKHLEDKLCL